MIDNLLHSTTLRDRVGAFTDSGRRSGVTVLLDMPPAECVANLPNGDVPAVLSEGGGSLARDIRVKARDTAHEVINYGRSAPLDLVARMVAHSLFGTAVDHDKARNRGIALSSSNY